MENRIAIIQKIKSKNVIDSKECFKILLDSCNKVLFEKFSSNEFKNEKQRYSHLIAEKAMLHGYSVYKLLSGIEVLNATTGKTDTFQDPSSIVVLWRSLLESYLTYNHINNTNTLESDFRYNLWLQFGLRNRIKAGNSKKEENVEPLSILKNDKINLEEILCEIKASEFYRGLLEENKSKFLKQIKRNWKIIIQGNNSISLGWQKLLDNTGINPELSNEVYNNLSWYSHTTCISVFQLHKMYLNGFSDSLTCDALRQSSYIISMFISDLARFDADYKRCYEKLTQDERDYINIYNYFIRNDKYTIDKLE